MAEGAGAVGRGERHHDQVADLRGADLGAHGLDDADRLVAHALPARGRPQIVRPEAAAADAGAGHADDRVGRMDDRGVSDVLDANVAGLVHDGCTHGGSPGSCHSPRESARYCSSLTCSIQVTGEPLSFSWTAMWLMAVVGAAPCQCFSPGSNQTTSPGRISSTGPPSRWTRPQPDITIRVWPSGWVCQAVRAPGSKVTRAPATRAGSGGLNSGSIRTVPVNQSAGPLPDGCEPLRLISIGLLLCWLAGCFPTGVVACDRVLNVPWSPSLRPRGGAAP